MTILYQPQSVVVNANGTAVFAVTALSSSPLTYQWQLNGSNISGATSSILMISNVTPTNLGTYSVLIINDTSAATIGNAVLSMPPHIETPFTGAVTYMGQSPDFNCREPNPALVLSMVRKEQPHFRWEPIRH